MEKELLVRLALCVDPRKEATRGLSERVNRSLGIKVQGISAKERQRREALRDKIRTEMTPYSTEDQAHVIPGLGPHPDAPADQQFQMLIPAEMLYAVSKKVLRGCEYWLADGRIIEPPYEIDVHLPREIPQDVLRAFGPFGPVSLGPGFKVRRAGVVDDPGVALYEIVIWESITVCFAILPPETPETS
jgi:hypothetical protein